MVCRQVCGGLCAAVFVLGLRGVAGQTIEKEQPMAADAHPAFEVATIKPSNPDNTSHGFEIRDRNLVIENETMNDLIAFAYGVHAKQIVGGPAWFGSQHFDIKGLADVPGSPNMAQYREMIQKLLADRFQLKFHREQRELSCFAVTVAKGGPKMEPSKSGPDALPDQTGHSSNGQVYWRFTNNSMADFAGFLQMGALDRPVVDQTGLKGRYNFKLTWMRDNAPATDENAPPGFFTAIQEQAGLKVEPSKAQVDVLVVDHVEQPSAD